MAKTKKKKAGKARAAKRTPARKSRKKAAAKRPARSAGTSPKRIAELEAENRRLRDELAALRAERESAPAAEPAPEGEDRPPAVDF
jgi:hypothetical protein